MARSRGCSQRPEDPGGREGQDGRGCHGPRGSQRAVLGPSESRGRSQTVGAVVGLCLWKGAVAARPGEHEASGGTWAVVQSGACRWLALGPVGAGAGGGGWLGDSSGGPGPEPRGASKNPPLGLGMRGLWRPRRAAFRGARVRPGERGLETLTLSVSAPGLPGQAAASLAA